MVKRGGLPRPAVPEQAGNQLQYLQNAPGRTTKKIRIEKDMVNAKTREQVYNKLPSKIQFIVNLLSLQLRKVTLFTLWNEYLRNSLIHPW